MGLVNSIQSHTKNVNIFRTSLQAGESLFMLISFSFFFYKMLIFLTALFYYFSCTGIWTQGFTFARQALYHLSHVSSSFCFAYFSSRALGYACLTWTTVLLFIVPLSWDDRCVPLPPAFYYLRWGGSLLHWMASNCNPPNLCLQSN
jgi:hypothetical protein